ncbi:MAG TPA: HIT domain-containing protein [Candidatus Nanoarchaeia archaeon]|nr:HIT domain-containing protein [Candidatus Nanoarchaeia archaeon]
MKNPLSEEQIKKINEISKLQADKQQIELQKFLKTLNPEQIEFLTKNQKGECPFCSIVSGKIPAKKIHEDDTVIAALDIRPANPGHLIVFPKKHYSLTAQMPDNEASHLFKIANKLAGKVFDVVKAEGTNIFVANGFVAGQTSPHVLVHVIPRFKDDNVIFQWEPKKIDNKENEKILSSLKNSIKPEQVVIKEEKKKVIKLKKRERVP